LEDLLHVGRGGNMGDVVVVVGRTSDTRSNDMWNGVAVEMVGRKPREESRYLTDHANTGLPRLPFRTDVNSFHQPGTITLRLWRWQHIDC